jgi:ATP-dependent Clp protease ATP-binding subunit ClpA
MADWNTSRPRSGRSGFVHATTPPRLTSGKRSPPLRPRFQLRLNRRCIGPPNANRRRHEYGTLERLLLALIDDVDASAVMKACKVDLGALKGHLVSYIDNDLKRLVIDDGESESRSTACFQRVIQRAVIHVQSSGREEATGDAAYFLQEQGMTRDDAINYLITSVWHHKERLRHRSLANAAKLKL